MSWLLLHFEYSRAPFQSKGKQSPGDCVVQALKQHEVMRSYAKGQVKGLFQLLGQKRLDDACARAQRAMVEAEADQELNPSTPMHEVIDVFKRLGKPEVLPPALM